MELNQIRYVATVARYNNFSKAAERLYITQPTLSQQVRKLEEEIGFPLFLRSTRAVSLTEEGKLFLQYATPLLEAYDTLVTELDNIKGNQSITIQLGVLPTFSHLNILETIHEYQSQRDDISVNITIRESLGLIDMLLDEQIDVAIANLIPSQIEGFEKAVETHIISHDAIYVVLHERHSLASRKEINIPELNQQKIILLGRNSSIRKQIEYSFKQTRVSPSAFYESPEIHSLIGMLQSNVGISFLSSRVADQYCSPPIISIPLKPEITTTTALIYLKKNKMADALEDFCSFIRSVYS